MPTNMVLTSAALSPGGKTSDGISIGVAPAANLLVGGVLIGNATLLTLVEGISWAVERGADIISLSLGFPYYEPLFTELFKALIEQFGVLPVAAIVRAVAAYIVSARVLRARINWLLLPIEDLLGFCFWIAGFFGNTISWRGRRYKLFSDGRFELLSSSNE